MLRPVPVFAGRGVIYDRTGKLLAWNAPASIPTVGDVADVQPVAEDIVSDREYATTTGLAHVIGYVQYPSKDSNGFYYREDFEGVDGVERYFDDRLRGANGSRLIEVDARGRVLSHNIIRPPKPGDNLTLSIDAGVQSALYRNLEDVARRVGFVGGAGVIMDAHTGELIALTSYPEYDQRLISERSDSARIKSLLGDPRLPFLNRAVSGLYTPGSILKPYIAIGALAEGVIDPATVITASGSISLPNPYDPTKSTVFRDWKDHGPVDMRRALSVSSDVYFYVVGGGYKDQKGLGISRIDKYLDAFGFGRLPPESFAKGKAGTIPTPEWKKRVFGEDWFLGNTYHTSIGQYGFQVTLVQVARAVSAIANGGTLPTPSILKGEILPAEQVMDIEDRHYKVVREGMRLSVTDGTGRGLNVPYVTIAAKSGTAELGVAKDHVNSWITGFWPYENPRYVFAVMLEKGSVHNQIGAASVMRQQLDWMNVNAPQYFKEPVAENTGNVR